MARMVMRSNPVLFFLFLNSKIFYDLNLNFSTSYGRLTDLGLEYLNHILI